MKTTTKNRKKVGVLPVVQPVSGEVNLGKSPGEFIKEGVNLLPTEQVLQKLGKAISGGVFASEESNNNHAGVTSTAK